MSERPPKTSSGVGMKLFYLVVICVAGVIFFKYYQNNISDYTSVPQEMQVNYIPSDFNYEMDTENALAILANPHRYKREFDELVYDFNMSLLTHVANRMGMADSLKVQLPEAYMIHHPYLKQLYFNDFVMIRDTSAGLYETWYQNESGGAVEAMNEVASKYTCFLINHVILTLMKDTDGTLNVKGKKVDTPCGIALTEALKPMMARLEEQASIRDFSRSKGLMEEKVERLIAELATVEITDKKAINKKLQTKIWGYAVSSSDIEISAISILKAGFKLDQYFDINLDSRQKKITVTLPEPVILSHEVFPKVDKLDIGWLREVQSIDLNKNFNLLRQEFRRDAIADNVYDKSKDQATEIMNMIFQPLMASHYKSYKLRVRFRNPYPNTIQEDIPVGDENIENPLSRR